MLATQQQPSFPAAQQQSQFSAAFLLEVKRQSVSRNKFATNMIRKLIPLDERKVSNVKGVLGKKKLDPEKLSQIRNVILSSCILVALGRMKMLAGKTVVRLLTSRAVDLTKKKKSRE